VSAAIVRAGYDRVAAAYARQRDEFASLPYLARLCERLPPGAHVLDVGCGAGVPVDRYLVERGCRVTGIDLSPVQIALARTGVPEAAYAVGDMSALHPTAYTVDAVVSLYAICHTPREQHGRILAMFSSFLPDGGLLLVTMGASAWEGVEQFHGAPMWWSHYDSATNRRLIEGAGFSILFDEIDTQHGEQHQIVLAARRSAP